LEHGKAVISAGEGAAEPSPPDFSSELAVARATLPAKVRKLLDTAATLADCPVTIGDADFLHAVLCQVGMPRKKVSDREFHRKNGRAELVIQAGHIEKRGKLIPMPVPYGIRPRLVLIHVATEAVRRRTRAIEVGDSIRQFIRTLGLDSNGREYKAFRLQMEALAACRLILGASYGGHDVTLNVQPFERFDAWLSHDGKQIGMWPSVLELSERFYDDLLEHAVPLAHEALARLKGSALALDVYTWLAHRLCMVKKPTNVSWANLRDQFGQEYRDPKDFKKKFRPALRQALAVYPDAKIDESRAGVIVLLPSKPPVTRSLVVVKKPGLDGG